MAEQDGLVDLTRQLAVLEERMETMNERYDKGWKLLEAKMAEDTARLREDIAKRDTANTRWLIGVITAATAIIIAVMAVLLSTS
ncbi:MAG: hypothetical protein OXH65_05160 [Paracoccaceae bacterium]|nr:hypothetical protein [Paracoccaceae bacterium]MDE2674480.1 hypothetical protein [Paracoccaceae bacterium]